MIDRRIFFSLLLVRPKQTVSVRVAVLETFGLSERASAVLVNHVEPADRDQFARWLQTHPRSSVRVRSKTEPEAEATIFRVRMCFGRGLILFKKRMAIRDGDALTIVA